MRAPLAPPRLSEPRKVEAEDQAAAELIAAADPYALAGLFESVEIRAWNWVFNNPENA